LGAAVRAIFRAETKRDEEAKAAERDKIIAGPNPETSVLEAHATELVERSAFPTSRQFLEGFAARYQLACEPFNFVPTYSVRLEFVRAAGSLYYQEALTEPPSKQVIAGTIEAGRYRDELLAFAKKIQDPGKVLDVLARQMTASVLSVTNGLPPLAREPFDTEDIDPNSVTAVDLIDTLGNPGQVIDDAITPFFEHDVIELGLFKRLREQIDSNYEREGHMPNADKRSGREIVAAFLRGTELESIFSTKIPFEIPIARRLEHTAIVAGSGWGKTQLLQSMIAGDLQKENPPAIVVIDSTGAIVRRVQRLAIFNQKLKDRLVIIDPELSPVPALNMFDISNPRLQQYDEALRESIESEIVGLFNYVFSSTENPLTAQQATPFAFMVRLLLSMPGANINTLIELLEDNPKNGYEGAAPHFKGVIERLDPTAQTFFKTQYYTRGTSEARRDQIAQRVYGVIKVPAFQRMFSTVNRIDMFAELNKGSIILVNTSENLLKEASATFGRYMIARTMAAAFERASIPEAERVPSFLIVDEAAPYFDDTFEKLLTRVRQFKLGVVIAFQHLEQATQKLRSAIASSTSVKYAGGVGYTDRSWLAREMETTHEFIGAQKKDSGEPPQWRQFACHVRNFTEKAVALTVPFYTLESMPKMTDAEHEALLERNRARVSADSKLEITAADFRSNDIPSVEPNGDLSQPVAAAPGPPRPAATTPDSDARTEGAAEWH
jgi:hypothetical protein